MNGNKNTQSTSSYPAERHTSTSAQSAKTLKSLLLQTNEHRIQTIHYTWHNVIPGRRPQSASRRQPNAHTTHKNTLTCIHKHECCIYNYLHVSVFVFGAAVSAVALLRCGRRCAAVGRVGTASIHCCDGGCDDRSALLHRRCSRTDGCRCHRQHFTGNAVQSLAQEALHKFANVSLVLADALLLDAGVRFRGDAAGRLLLLLLQTRPT